MKHTISDKMPAGLETVAIDLAKKGDAFAVYYLIMRYAPRAMLAFSRERRR